MDPVNPSCKEFASPSVANFCFSLLILVGILISYLPQHYRIIARRTSFGISPYFILLGTTTGTTAFANVLVLPKSATQIACCSEIGPFPCFAGLLGILQIGTQAACFAVIMILFIIYFPRFSTTSASPTQHHQHQQQPIKASPSDAPSFKIAVLVAIICVVHAVATIILAAVVVIAHPSSRQQWANILGIIAAILASLQYLPQIYTTFRLHRVESLSIPMMFIQTPGGLVWTATLFERLGVEGWSTWTPYLVSAVLQGVLLALGVYFEYLSPQKPGETGSEGNFESNRNGADGIGDGDNTSEETPLLQS